MVEKMADEAAKSDAIDRRLGAFLLYSGIVDFRVIQSARLVEQIMLKGQLAEKKQLTFQPHPNSYFYDNPTITTRKILVGIEDLMPFKSYEKTEEADRLTKLAINVVKAGHVFLDMRNPITHHIGNPTLSFDDLKLLCQRGFEAYQRFRRLNKEFFQLAGPYCFSEQEIAYFYGGDIAKHDLLS